MAFTYQYPRPALTVDGVVFGLDEGELKVMLIGRRHEPFQGEWALPGGFVEMDETLEGAARRELEEETDITDVYLEQLYSFGAVDRDPRERVVSVAYYAVANIDGHKFHARTDAAAAAWFGIQDCQRLAFDHDEILAVAHRPLQGKVRCQPIGFRMLPERFTLSQIQRMYEIILAKELDKRNFRKQILSMDLLVDLNDFQQDVAHRAARLYRFDEHKYRRLAETGFSLEI